MKKSRNNLKTQNEQDYARKNKALLSTSNNSYLNSDSQSNFNSRSKKKGNEKAVILGINTSSNKNSSKDGTFKIHHYRNDYDPDLIIEISQIMIKKKDQLLALDKYVFGNNTNNKQNKGHEKKVNIIGINPENQQPSKITSSHRHRVKNPNPRPGQITATAVLTPDGLYQQISSTDGEYITIDSSAQIDSNDPNNNIAQRQLKFKPESSFESSDIFKKNKSPTKSIQAEIESSFIDSNIGISPRNPHGMWKNTNNQQDETIEVEYEYVTVDEEEEGEEKENEEKVSAKREVSFVNINNQNEEEIIEYEIIEEEEEEEEAELEPMTNNQNPNQQSEEEAEYEYVFEEDENEDKDQLVPSNSLGDVQPLNVFQQKQAPIDTNNSKISKNKTPDYDEENDYATTEENINTQSFMISEQNKARKDDDVNEEEEEEAETVETNTQNEIQNEINAKQNSENEEEQTKTNNDENIQQEKPINESDNNQNSSKNQIVTNNSVECSGKSEQNETNLDKTNDNDQNSSSKSEKKAKFADNTPNTSESINVNDIQFSTANQYDPKDSEPTVSVFEEYVFADEKEKEKQNEKEKEEEQKPKLTIVNENKSISKINDSSFGFNNSQVQERNEKQISNTLNNLVQNRNQIIKSEIESTEININIVDDFNQNNHNNNNSSNLSSPSKALKKLFLSPSNAVESKSATTGNNTTQNKNESSNNEKDQNQTSSNSQFNFEKGGNNNKQQAHTQFDNELSKVNEAADDQVIPTCDLDMSNIQRSPPARENRNQNNKDNHNSDDYYSHEYYTTMETNEISNRRDQNKNPNSKSNKNNSRSSKQNKNKDNDSYYSYSYYSDAYTYSYDPSTIDAKQRRNKHQHRRHNNEYTYEYVTNATYETMDRGIRPTNDRSNQLPIELQKQIQNQLQQQIQLNSTPQNNQTTPYSIRLRVKDSQRKLFNFDNGNAPKFILRTVSEDGKSTPHNIELILETKPSSSQTPAQSTTNSASQSPAVSVPTSPTQQKPKNQSVQFDIPQIIQSGPHKGLIKRRIKRSEKIKRENEKNLMQVEEEIRKMEQMIVEQDEKKKLQQQQQQQQKTIADASVEITTSSIGTSENSPFAKKAARARGKKTQKQAQNEKQQVQSRNTPSTVSKSSKALSSSSTNSPNKRHYYDENGNPVLVEVSDATGRPVFRRIAGKSSASSSIKHGNSNPNFKAVTQSLPRPIKGRNVSLNEKQQQQQKKQQLFGTPKRENKKLLLDNDDYDDDDKNSLKKSPVKNVKVNHQIHLNNDHIDEKDLDIDLDSDDDDDDFIDFNNKNIENQRQFGKVYRSRKAPHIKKAKFQNPQIHLKPRNDNSNGSSGGQTPLKKAVLASDSDSDFDEDDEEPFRPKNLSPDSKRRKQEELTKKIEKLRQSLSDQAANDDNKDDIDRYRSNKKANGKPPSIPSNQRKQPKRFVNDEEYDPFEEFDSNNLDNIQRSPYEPRQNLNNNNNFNNNNRFNLDRPPPIQLNPPNRHPSDGSASSLTERRKMPKITVEIPAKGNEGQADVFRRHYENASPEKSPQKTPERNQEVNEYYDDSVPLNASTKNTFKNLEEENLNDQKDDNHSSSNLSSKRRVRRRMRVSVHDGSRSPAPHLSSNPLKDSKLSSNPNSKPNTNSNSNSPSKKQRETVRPLIDTFKANLRQKLNSSDDDDSDDENEVAQNPKNADQDSITIGAMNPVQAKKLEESKKQNEIAPLTPPADADFNQSSSMLSNAPPPSPKNQDVEIVMRDGKRKRKKKVSLSPRSGTHSHSSKNSGARGNVIRSHHLKDSEKYPQDSPPPSVLSSIANENDLND